MISRPLGNLWTCAPLWAGSFAAALTFFPFPPSGVAAEACDSPALEPEEEASWRAGAAFSSAFLAAFSFFFGYARSSEAGLLLPLPFWGFWPLPASSAPFFPFLPPWPAFPSSVISSMM